jgi:uncharacterized protein
MNWIWDDAKSRANRRKHGLGFDTARLVFDDPLSLSRLDDHSDEERWQTVGRIGSVTVLVIHTAPADYNSQGRIISARKATVHERKAYEEGTF